MSNKLEYAIVNNLNNVVVDKIFSLDKARQLRASYEFDNYGKLFWIKIVIRGPGGSIRRFL